MQRCGVRGEEKHDGGDFLWRAGPTERRVSRSLRLRFLDCFLVSPNSLLYPGVTTVPSKLSFEAPAKTKTNTQGTRNWSDYFAEVF
jgi:hypothetical protein